jgi:hypothetical protein
LPLKGDKFLGFERLEGKSAYKLFHKHSQENTELFVLSNEGVVLD